MCIGPQSICQAHSEAELVRVLMSYKAGRAVQSVWKEAECSVETLQAEQAHLRTFHACLPRVTLHGCWHVWSCPLTLLPPWAAACAACRSRRSNTDCCTKFARYDVLGRVFYVLLDSSHRTGWEGEVCFEPFAATPHR